jgi:DEAD/DEAH box helicase domain protein
LAEIHRRHADAEEMMTAFLTSDLTTKQRWDLIEDYFLGHDEVVAQVLGLNEEN